MKKHILFIFAGLILFAGCKPTDFGDTNVDPRLVTQAPTRTLLTFALQQSPFVVFDSPNRQLTGYDNLDMNFYAQYLSEGPYPGSSLYSTRFQNWGAWYTGPLYNLQSFINFVNENNALADPGANGSANNQLAVARILKAYYFWFLTDKYGDIPYSEALKGNLVLQPKFDKQKDIYYDLFKELTEAQAQINVSEKGVAGDILLNSNMLAWKKMANTIRLFMSLRLLKNDAAKAQTEYTAALAAGVLESNTDNVIYQYIGSDPNNWNPWYENYINDNRNDYAISSTIGNYMIGNADPRIRVYGEILNGEVRPLAYGNQGAVSIPGDYSRLGPALQGPSAPAPMFTYAQVLFVKAEGALKGLAAGDAAQLYRDGIKASMEQWGVYTLAAYNAYIAKANVVYSPATGLQQIITQKWAHQYLNGFEAWTDWRRTGFPVLTPAPGAAQGGGIPRRMGYPTNTSALNEVNYNAVVASQGADNNFTRIWWDK